MKGDVYGGGMGRLAGKDEKGADVEAVAALVGNTKVNLNGMEAGDYSSDYNSWGLVQESEGKPHTVDPTKKGCILTGTGHGRIFGCNNINGTPKGMATVHVFATQNVEATQIANAKKSEDTAKKTGIYDVEAVYGGGNLAAYEPTNAARTNTDDVKKSVYAYVVIDGCDHTSIRQVYGGGNAASTPATRVDINGTFEIEEAFGGGNGKDQITVNGVLKDNPGANVGFYDYSEKDAEPGGDGTYDTKAKRQVTEFINKYTYGSGEAQMNVHGGKVHRVYGGSNTKGNVRITAVTILEDASGCPLDVDEAYGGGKSAPMDAESRLEMACIPGLKVAYGGAEDANIEGDVNLTITNGTFERVFGGNNVRGEIKGTITVNIEETGCKPIIIGQLYGGGNQAPYTAPDGKHGPTLNVRSFTSIGEIYGGGYGESAVVTGDTYVNINVSKGKFAVAPYIETPFTYPDNKTINEEINSLKNFSFTEYVRKKNDAGVWDFDYNEDLSRKTRTVDVKLDMPDFTVNKIGAIGTVYGGGNAAKVDGSTNVNIGTLSSDVFVTPTTATEADRTIAVEGADIRSNVYGGGNQAEVTGNTNVVIGK